jgi:Asp-tRNA(Asn)/Glu-tRNA(Gln) amidotransferase A subunit family amidase
MQGDQSVLWALMRLASEADTALSRGESVEPLHGVPITVKDWIDVRGFPCAGEDLSNAGRKPESDATVIKRLRNAGAIVIAKTNVNSLPRDGTQSVGR